MLIFEPLISQTKSKPRRPAPSRPTESGQKSGSDSGGHVTPEVTNTSPNQRGPPPPPQRNTSLSISTASGVVTGESWSVMYVNCLADITGTQKRGGGGTESQRNVSRLWWCLMWYVHVQ